MKRLLLIPIALLAIALAGCSGNVTGPPPISSTQVSDVITQVQNGVKTGCSVAVQASSVASILSAVGVPYIGMVSDIATQICGAFNRAGASRRGVAVLPTLMVNGKAIKLRGHRV